RYECARSPACSCAVGPDCERSEGAALRHLRDLSEDELERQLNLAREVRIALSYRALDNLPERGVVRIVIELLQRHPEFVEHVERLDPELGAHAFLDPGHLAKRHIELRLGVKTDPAGAERCFA